MWYGVVWCGVVWCCVLFCSVQFCSVLFCSVLFCSVLFCLHCSKISSWPAPILVAMAKAVVRKLQIQLYRHISPRQLSFHQRNCNCYSCYHLLLQVDGLYLMMGRGLSRLHEVPAGNVIAIGGLGTAILKSATITSTPACRPLAPMLFQASAAFWYIYQI